MLGNEHGKPLPFYLYTTEHWTFLAGTSHFVTCVTYGVQCVLYEAVE